MRYSGINIGRIDYNSISSLLVGEVDEFFKDNEVTSFKELPNGIAYHKENSPIAHQYWCKIPEHNPLFNYCILEEEDFEEHDILIMGIDPIIYKQLSEMLK